MKRQRDSQRSKAWKCLAGLPDGERFGSCAETKKYMVRTLELRVISRRFGFNLAEKMKNNINVLGGRPTSYPGRYTKFASFYMDEKHALYHLAYHIHHWTKNQEGLFHSGDELPYWDEGMSEADAAWHGWQFCFIWYTLVRYRMGKEAGDQLKALFKEHKVRYRPKRKREVTSAQLAALRKARMKANEDLIAERWERARQKKRGIEL